MYGWGQAQWSPMGCVSGKVPWLRLAQSSPKTSRLIPLWLVSPPSLSNESMVKLMQLTAQFIINL
jgi:hypothetical protein